MKFKLNLKIKRKTLAIIAAFALALVIPYLVFLVRSPVLIVTDIGFVPLYGEARIRSESRRSSISLFRRVKTVSIADDAADDAVRIAINDVSFRPFCVIFPLRFIRSARLFHEESPRVPVILLEGRNSNDNFLSVLGGNLNDYFIYQTDIESDFYRAGMAASVLDMERNGEILVFHDSSLRPQAREAFLRAVNSLEKPLDTLFFTSFSEYTEKPDVSCVVFAGAGVEYLEKEIGTPVIFFTWIDPALFTNDVVLVINDSPWIQCVQAVRMAAARKANGQIQSEFQVINKENVDKETLRKIRK